MLDFVARNGSEDRANIAFLSVESHVDHWSWRSRQRLCRRITAVKHGLFSLQVQEDIPAIRKAGVLYSPCLCRQQVQALCEWRPCFCGPGARRPVSLELRNGGHCKPPESR